MSRPILLVSIILVIIYSCSTENRIRDNSDDSPTKEQDITVALVIQQDFGSYSAIDNDSVDGWYAQIIMCNNTAVMHGFALENAENKLDESNYIWLSEWYDVEDYSIQFRALSDEEKAIVKNAHHNLKNSYIPLTNCVKGVPLIKLYIDGNLVASEYSVLIKGLPDNVKEVIYQMLAIGKPLWPMSETDIMEDIESSIYEILK